MFNLFTRPFCAERMSVSVLGRICAVVLFPFILVVMGCSAQDNDVGATPSAPTVSRQIGPEEFEAAISEPNRVTINVHVPYEGDIAGTDLSIPFDQISSQIGTVLPDRNTPLAIYCRSGRMSESALAELNSLGYVNVLELRGGMQAWEATGRAVIMWADLP